MTYKTAIYIQINVVPIILQDAALRITCIIHREREKAHFVELEEMSAI